MTDKIEDKENEPLEEMKLPEGQREAFKGTGRTPEQIRAVNRQLIKYTVFISAAIISATALSVHFITKEQNEPVCPEPKKVNPIKIPSDNTDVKPQKPKYIERAFPDPKKQFKVDPGLRFQSHEKYNMFPVLREIYMDKQKKNPNMKRRK